MQCNFCHKNDLKEAYTPKGSWIAIVILVCQNCGLVQSKWEKRERRDMKIGPSGQPEIEKLSCDADYSEVRVGKGQMAPAAIEMLNDNVDHSEIREVLDMCSGRGHFVRQALECFNLKSIDCMDPDQYMTVSYADDPRINLTIGTYDAFKTDKIYDLIYSCHTLEHYRDPASNIKFIIDHLRPNGYMMLDVPNLETIHDESAVDDFFYDYHKYYFSRTILKNFLISLGMVLVAENESSGAIMLLMKKSGHTRAFQIDHAEVDRNEALIRKYRENLAANRDKLPDVVRKMNDMARGKRNAILGCGRMLDALIVYGGLDLNNFEILIDNYLIDATSRLYGRQLNRSSILDSEKVDNIFLATRSATSALAVQLAQQYPNLNVVQVSGLFE